MRFILPFLLCFVCSWPSHAQPWLELLPKNTARTELTFKDYQKAFYDYWAPYQVTECFYDKDGQKIKAAGYKQFKRWEWLQEQRTHPVTGDFPKKSAFALVEERNQLFPSLRNSPVADWESLGPTYSEGNGDGLGRINSIAFHPSDPNTIWAGSPSGGFWVSHNDGQNWTCLTDHLESLGATDVVINPDFETSQTIYVATGDRDSYDNISIGVIKSTDGGNTWLPTGLTFELQDLRYVNRLLQNHANAQILYAATGDGVFKTSNGGDTWDELLTDEIFMDMEIHPGNPDILYGSTSFGEVFVSLNGGENWKRTLLRSSGRRTELAVTPADPSRIYAVTTTGGLEGIYRSDDAGTSFQLVFDGETLNLMHWNSSGIGEGGQAWYDLAMAASALDPDDVVVGGINTWMSKDGGYTWSIKNVFAGGGPVQAVHADKHFLAFRGHEIWEGNDGGINVSRDTGLTWIDKTNGMAISQMYRLAVAQTEPFEVLTGLQDNGTKYLSDNTWEHINGGDGTEAMIDYSNAEVQYSSSQYGSLFRTTDRWESARYVKPALAGEGSWVTPFAMDPVQPNVIYAGYKEIWKSVDRCTTWTQISDISAFGKIRSIAIAPSDPNTIYVAENAKIWKTTTGEGPFEKVTATSLTNTNQITYLTVKKDDPDIVWASVGGFWDPGVYEIRGTTNNYVDISEGLPKIPVFCVIQNHQYDGVQLFAGTELGVYVKTDDEPWMPFSIGLPNVITSELEIYYAPDPTQSKLRAATYGRGLWETRIAFASSPMVYIESSAHMASLHSVNPGQQHQEILRINISTEGDLEALHAIAFTFNTHGTTHPENDITAAHLYYTGPVNLFSVEQELASTTLPNGEFVMTCDQILTHGDNYFWLAYDVSPDAILWNVLDAQCNLLNIGEDKIPQLRDPFGARSIELTYCEAGSTNLAQEYISRVVMGDVDNTTTKGPDGYQNYSNLIINMEMGQHLPLSVTNPFPHPTDELLVWIDWNQNGDFSYPDELVHKSGPLGVSVYQVDIAPTVNAKTGTTMMRLRLHDTAFGPNATPCGDSNIGEVEDYSVHISDDVTGTDGDGLWKKFKLYPNPVADKLVVEWQGQEGQLNVEVLDIFGTRIHEAILMGKLEIDTRDFVKGVYMIRLENGLSRMFAKVD